MAAKLPAFRGMLRDVENFTSRRLSDLHQTPYVVSRDVAGCFSPILIYITIYSHIPWVHIPGYLWGEGKDPATSRFFV